VNLPDRQVNLLHRFVSQGKGQLSKRGRSEEFAALTDAEVQQIEQFYHESLPAFRAKRKRHNGRATLRLYGYSHLLC
jgi:hypothetical protein